MKKIYLLILLSLFYIFPFPTLALGDQVKYSAHIAYDGWLNWVYDGQTAGKPGSRKQTEAVKIMVTGFPSTYHIDYQAHVAYDGWLDWVSDGEVAGTTGEADTPKGKYSCSADDMLRRVYCVKMKNEAD